MPGFPVHYQLSQIAQTHVPQFADATNHLILFRPLLLRPSIFPSIRVFSNESVLCIRWPKDWSFSFSISPSNEHPGLISFRMDWLDLLAVQGNSQESSPAPQFKSINFSCLACLLRVPTKLRALLGKRPNSSGELKRLKGPTARRQSSTGKCSWPAGQSWAAIGPHSVGSIGHSPRSAHSAQTS